MPDRYDANIWKTVEEVKRLYGNKIAPPPCQIITGDLLAYIKAKPRYSQLEVGTRFNFEGWRWEITDYDLQADRYYTVAVGLLFTDHISQSSISENLTVGVFEIDPETDAIYRAARTMWPQITNSRTTLVKIDLDSLPKGIELPKLTEGAAEHKLTPERVGSYWMAYWPERDRLYVFCRDGDCEHIGEPYDHADR